MRASPQAMTSGHAFRGAFCLPKLFHSDPRQRTQAAGEGLGNDVVVEILAGRTGTDDESSTLGHKGLQRRNPFGPELCDMGQDVNLQPAQVIFRMHNADGVFLFLEIGVEALSRLAGLWAIRGSRASDHNGCRSRPRQCRHRRPHASP